MIDLGHLSYRYLFTQTEIIKEIGYDILRHSLLSNGIFPYISTFKPDKVYICADYKKSWRKEEASFYKAQRASNREKQADKVEWDKFFEFMDNFIVELRDNFPFYTIAVPTLEADDVIGWLAANLPSDDEKVIVTGDGDYIQLLKYNKVKLWEPKKKKFVVCPDPEAFLMKKIIIGDTSDNIPGVRKGTGEAKADKLIESGEIHKLLSELDAEGKPCEFRRNYDRNKKLIDLTCTPDNLINDLKNYLINYKMADENLFNYFIDYKLREMFDNLNRYRSMCEKLNKTEGE